jgi:hypothetical protein
MIWLVTEERHGLVSPSKRTSILYPGVGRTHIALSLIATQCTWNVDSVQFVFTIASQ